MESSYVRDACTVYDESNYVINYVIVCVTRDALTSLIPLSNTHA